MIAQGPTETLRAELAKLLEPAAVLPDVPAAYLVDAAGALGFEGRADAVVRPASAQDVATLMAWCAEHEVPVTPRGGGSGLAGGAVPLRGGVVLDVGRLRRVRALDPLQWRMHVEAGLPTSEVHRLARENGLYFPPDPGASEQSQIGGNVATNAGGPHAFKYGVTGAWVTGLEVVTASGQLVQLGGAARKDVAGYDLRHLFVGSEGTLGIVTAVWLRLIPAPERRLALAAFYPSAAEGAAAIERVMGSGLQPASLEYLDAGALAAVAQAYPGKLPRGAGFAVLAEADGGLSEAAALRDALEEALGQGALGVHAHPLEDALWRWRDGVSGAVTATLGRKLSEDVAVPVDRLAEAIEVTAELGAAHGLPTCSWGHAGDGNLHASFLFATGDDAALRRAEEGAAKLFAAVRSMGGSLSGEHGIGVVKRRHLLATLDDAEVALHRAVKHALDPKGLLNPGKVI
jgi:glycolate oxidase subunit GlcD